MSGGTLVKILLGETLGPVGRLPGETLLEMLSYADYVQVNCFVPIQLAKDKSMIAVTGVEGFHCRDQAPVSLLVAEISRAWSSPSFNAASVQWGAKDG